MCPEHVLKGQGQGASRGSFFVFKLEKNIIIPTDVSLFNLPCCTGNFPPLTTPNRCLNLQKYRSYTSSGAKRCASQVCKPIPTAYTACSTSGEKICPLSFSAFFRLYLVVHAVCDAKQHVTPTQVDQIGILLQFKMVFGILTQV